MSVHDLLERARHAKALGQRTLAVESGLTAKDRARLLEYAKRRARMLSAAGARCVEHPNDIVTDAITDTIVGDVTWIDGVPLYVHLVGVIRSRTSALAAAALRAPHVPVDRETVGELDVAPGPDVQIAARRALRDAVAWLEPRADAEVMHLVGAYLEGARTRSEVAATTGLSVEVVTAARRRLDRLLTAMSRDAGEEELSRSGTW